MTRAETRYETATLAPIAVLPEAILLGLHSAHLRRLCRGLLGPLYVDSCRLLCANSGHSQTVRRTGQVDQKRSFGIGSTTHPPDAIIGQSGRPIVGDGRSRWLCA
jgi:hypothetical protein